MSIDYKVNTPVTPDQFIAVLRASTLGERRPIDDRACIEGMLAHANLTGAARTPLQAHPPRRARRQFVLRARRVREQPAVLGPRA